jgi:hypothetical protein
MGRDMRIPDFVSARLPKSKRANVGALFTALFVVVVVAVLIPVHRAATVTRAVAVPPPAAIVVDGHLVEPGSPAVAGLSLPVVASLPAKAGSSPKAGPSSAVRHLPIVSPPPVAGASHAGQVMLNAAGSRLASWNQTQSFCSGESWEVPDGTVSTDSSGDAVLATTGKPGSCVGLVSPGAYSSAVIEAYIYFPPVPGKPGSIANWTSLWLTDQATWPADGELDAVEAEPVTGVNATAWHWGAAGSPQSMSTDGFAQDGKLPVDGPNLTPGWHVVDIVYTKGFFAVYYDGRQFTSLNSGVITGSPLNILITTSVTPDISQVEQTIGGPPLNSDSSPAGLAVKFVKIWSYK